MKSILLNLLVFICFSVPLIGQSINTPFGKNRVQYHDDFDKWDKYETENFITYWYGKSRNIGHATVQMAELDHDEIQRILEHRINKKLEIIVYSDLSDLKQSNIGNEEAFHSANESTKIVGNKMFVYFDGDHRHLRKQIRRGIAAVYINSILFGSNLQEQVQNAILLRLPDWFKLGLESFAGSNWDFEIEDQLKDIITSDPERYLRFDKLELDYPEIAGHSMWYYLEQMYGISNIANLVYLTRINRRLQESFYYILGVPFDQIKKDWSKFYMDGFQLDTNSELLEPENVLQIKNKRNLPYSNVKLGPKGKLLAYVTNDRGKYRLNLYNLETSEVSKIFKGGTKNIFQETDYSYPLISWNPSGRYISIIYEHRDIIYLREIDVVDGEIKETNFPDNYHRIYNFDYIDSENYMINASLDGFSDLFTFSVKSRSTKRLTEDFYDDLDASVIKLNGQQGIIFSSNRPTVSTQKEKLDTILPLASMDLFFMPLIEKEEATLTRLTNTKEISEREALKINDNNISYLSNQSGSNQRYILNNTDGYRNSDCERNILSHSYNSKIKSFFYTSKYNTENYILVDELDLDKKLVGEQTNINPDEKNEVTPLILQKPKEEILPSYLFKSEFSDPENLEDIIDNTKEVDPTLDTSFEKYFSNYFSESVQDGKRIIKFSPMRATAARLQFRWYDVTTKLDNDVLFEGLQSYTENRQDALAQPMGVLLKTEVKDIFEDYKFSAGIRVPINFNGSETFMVFDDNKHLFDHRYALYRRSITTIIEDGQPNISTRSNSMLGLYRIKYPFDVYRSLSFTGSLRFDKLFFLSVDENTFSNPQDREKRISAKFEYIFDNSFDVGLNIKNGARYKVYLEAINEFDLQVVDGFDFSLSNGFTSILGFDARYYQPILRHAVLAFRGAGAASFGSKKMLYYIGGVEGAVGGQFNNDIPIPAGENFAYNTLAPHLRGFDYNIRNGSKFLLSNIELRLPVLKLLGVKRTRFGFLRDLQFIGFFDAGLAWHGSSPFDDKNPFNSNTLENPPLIVVNVKYFKDPLVMGYGAGIRSTVLGYFVKLDYAIGLETRQAQDPKIYFSVGKDF